ncbi:MAG: phage holin family protein [Actinobacteria bacterium]|nr:phage holin family protein [Actinomycetota bacterium]
MTTFPSRTSPAMTIRMPRTTSHGVRRTARPPGAMSVVVTVFSSGGIQCGQPADDTAWPRERCRCITRCGCPRRAPGVATLLVRQHAAASPNQGGSMVRFLASVAMHLIANAVGLAIAALVLPGFHIQAIGFVVSVLLFTAVEVLLGPFVLKMAIQYAPALRGGIALVTTFLGLLVTSLLTDGLRIEGVTTWVLAPLIVWLCVLLAAILLPMVLFKNVLGEAHERRAG